MSYGLVQMGQHEEGTATRPGVVLVTIMTPMRAMESKLEMARRVE